MVISCHETFARTRKQTWLTGVPHVILIGDPFLQQKWDFNPALRVCKVRCKDDYASLSAKVHLGFQFMVETFDPDYIFKVDDDVMLRVENIPSLTQYDYVGRYSTNSLLVYCGGPLYYLSKKALHMLSTNMNHSHSSAEDVNVGHTLFEHGIYPTMQPLYTDLLEEYKADTSILAVHDKRQALFPVTTITAYQDQRIQQEQTRIQKERAEFTDRMKLIKNKYHLIL